MSQFYFVNGAVVGNLAEFVSALENADDATFSYHCNKEKNDFYAWLSDIKPDAAKIIQKIKTRKGMIKKLKSAKK